MGRYRGKFHSESPKEKKRLPFMAVFSAFLLIELFAFCFLLGSWKEALFPLLFSVLWSGILSCVTFILSGMAAKIFWGICYFASVVYAGFQTGYYILFSEMMWLSDFRYASEGADYADVLLTYPVLWWLGLIALILVGCLTLWRFPVWKRSAGSLVLSVLLVAGSCLGIRFLPEYQFAQDSQIQYAGSDYGRAQSAEAVYKNMFNTHRLYRLCGLYQ